MDWWTPGEVLGYLGTLSLAGGAATMALRQHASALYWSFIVVGDLFWISAGFGIGSGAVLFSQAVFFPVTLVGIARYHRLKKKIGYTTTPSPYDPAAIARHQKRSR